MDELIKSELNRIQDENNRQNKRIDALEKEMTDVRNIALSVDRLANNMERMVEEQKDQGERLKSLEREPADNWINAKRIILNTIIGAFAGGLAIGLIMLIAQNL